MTPPCSVVTAGRPLPDLLNILNVHRNSHRKYIQLTGNVAVSQLNMTLIEYIVSFGQYCKLSHSTDCKVCPPLIAAAQVLEKNGIYPLSSLFREVFPSTSYNTREAKQCFLQMPVAAVRCGNPAAGFSKIYLMEMIPGSPSANAYERIVQFYYRGVEQARTAACRIDRQEAKQLLSLAQSDREREFLRYAIFQASGLTQTAARKLFGFENMWSRVERVQDALQQAEQVNRSVDELARTKERAVCLSLGMPLSETESDSSSSSSSDAECDDPDPISNTDSDVEREQERLHFSGSELSKLGEESKYNYFEVAAKLEDKCGRKFSPQEHEELFHSLMSESNSALLKQSYSAFKCDQSDFLSKRMAGMYNGLIVTDSESEDVEVEKIKEVVRQRSIIQRKMRRERAKRLAKLRLLSRKVSTKLHGIISDYPTIGKEIEKFVEERNVGADRWRRTGVLTFDGNQDVKQKVTYERIRKHLQEVYHRHFSYGTVVQLCVARNKRRKSAKNYHGVAKVTTRRARKGFCLKYNPDHHWSSAFYRGLNWLQYTDGCNILNVNRDDASGFRLDTMATHHQHPMPVVQQTTTTHTDYVSKYPSTLQTTSYNFSATETTPEMCSGVVKPSKLFPKNPAQHASDLEMLSKQPELQTAFVSPRTGASKMIECIRVDGAGDEGPGHLEVQFWWTVRHFEKGTSATLVTTRNSGSSYLNRVELQNGCLALAHSQLFIPSTLKGPCTDPVTGEVDKSKLAVNLSAAVDVYISRCNRAPCGDAEIHLFKGSDSSCLQRQREELLIFLKGTKKQKDDLREKQPENFSYFQKIWGIREKHMVKELPSQYVYFLLPCYEEGCPHPVCVKGKPAAELTWFENGPELSYLPFPVKDPERPWGGENCSTCSGFCAGHYMQPQDAYIKRSDAIKVPPSQVLFSKYKSNVTNEEDAAEEVLLTEHGVQMWMEHLRTVDQNRKRGARKAAATRRKKKESAGVKAPLVEWRCGDCGLLYENETEEEELWIQCENGTCNRWYHAKCVGICHDSIPESFICHNCH